MTLPPNFQKIADAHQQLRDGSCFQMGPELALKFARIIDMADYPYQNQPQWDGRGFEPYSPPFQNAQWTVVWTVGRFDYPYAGMVALFQAELKDQRYPIVSLLPPNHGSWHAYIVVAPIGSDDLLLATKRGSLQSPPCITEVDTLLGRTQNKLKVDYMIWRATRKQTQQSAPTA
jgi:hypothetical protein